MGLKSVGCKEESELWKRVLDEELMMRRRRGEAGAFMWSGYIWNPPLLETVLCKASLGGNAKKEGAMSGEIFA